MDKSQSVVPESTGEDLRFGSLGEAFGGSTFQMMDSRISISNIEYRTIDIRRIFSFRPRATVEKRERKQGRAHVLRQTVAYIDGLWRGFLRID